MKVQAILNPRAGIAAQRALGALREGGGAWGSIPVALTERPGHARELASAAAAEGADLVLAAGGDGTVNEAASGLLGSRTALGLIPVGSGNGLARTLGIPLEPAPALRALEGGVTRAMDVGFANERLFLNVAGAGFDAAVGADFHSHGKVGGRRGILSYVRLGLARVWSYEPQVFELIADDARFEGPAFVIAFANGRQYGAGVVIAKRARLDDGLLDVAVFEKMSLARVAFTSARLFLGGFDDARGYRSFKAAKATLRARAPFPYHRDGEPEPGEDVLRVEVRPRALRVQVPRAIAEDPEGPFLQS